MNNKIRKKNQLQRMNPERGIDMKRLVKFEKYDKFVYNEELEMKFENLIKIKYFYIYIFYF